MNEPSGRDADAGAVKSPVADEPGIPSVVGTARASRSKKSFAALILLASLAVVAVLAVQRCAPRTAKSDEASSSRSSERPAAASGEPRRLEMPDAPRPRAAMASSPIVPALIPTDQERAEPIGIRRSGSTTASGASAKTAAPEDAPVLLVSARSLSRPAERLSEPDKMGTSAASDELPATSSNLAAYQRQLQGMLASLTGSVTGTASGPGASPQASGLFGGQLQGTATPRVTAATLGNRSLTLPKGTAFTCALKTKIVSAASGMVACQVQRNVYGDDGRVLLIERGSHMDGEYRITSVKPGTVRIPVVWTRVRTPLGVTIDIESPGTGPLGESGIDGYVDNRWGERIGAAMLLSLIDDSVKLVIQNQSNETQGSTIVLPSTTSSSSKLAEKVLDSTINIPPLIYQNQGGIVGIVVARDVDFSSVYELKPVTR